MSGSASPGSIVLVLLLVLATVAVVVALVVWLVRTLRRAPTPPAAPLRPDLSVVLAHGLLGFDEMRLAGQRYEYFRGVAGHLQELGAEVHCPRVPPVASIEARAEALARYVEQLPGEQIHIIAHSLGGLDARFAIAELGLGSTAGARP